MTPSKTLRIGAILRAQAQRDAERRARTAERAGYGKRFRPDHAEATVTLRHRDTGAALTVVATVRGGTLDALRAALEGRDPSKWRVACVSTPQSILSDLKQRSQPRGQYERAVLGQAGLSAFMAE